MRALQLPILQLFLQLHAPLRRLQLLLMFTLFIVSTETTAKTPSATTAVTNSHGSFTVMVATQGSVLAA